MSTLFRLLFLAAHLHSCQLHVHEHSRHSRGRSLQQQVGARVGVRSASSGFDFYAEASWFKDGRQLSGAQRTGRGVAWCCGRSRFGQRSFRVAAVKSRAHADSRVTGPAVDEIATTSGGGKTVGHGEMGRSRSRSKSPSRRRHKSKHSRKRSKSREKHSNNKYSDKPKERTSKSRCVPPRDGRIGAFRVPHRAAKRLDLADRPSCRTPLRFAMMKK